MAAPPALLLGALGLFAALPAEAQNPTPAAPTNLSVSRGNGGLQLSWTAPSGTLTGYDIHYTSAASGTVANDATATGSDAAAAWVADPYGASATDTSEFVSDLSNGVTYRVRLRAKNSAGAGAWAFGTGTPNVVVIWTFSTSTVAEGSAGQRVALATSRPQSAVSGTLTYAAGTSNPASLSADLTAGYATTFSAAANKNLIATLPTPVNDTLNEEHETFTITINAGTGYVVGSPSKTTVTITDNDPPAAPSGLSLTAGSGKLSASWTKPAGPVTGYQLRYKQTTATDQTATTAGDPSTGWVTSTASITTTSGEITGLTNGTAYHVQVRATDGQTQTGNGYGAWSASQSGTPAAAASTDATLSALTATSSTSSTGSFTSLSIGTFASGTTSYTATVANTVTHVKLTPTVSDSDATVKVGKGSSLTTVSSSTASGAIALSVGANALKVEVTAEDGTTTKSYTVTVTRQQAAVTTTTTPPPDPDPDPSGGNTPPLPPPEEVTPPPEEVTPPPEEVTPPPEEIRPPLMVSVMDGEAVTEGEAARFTLSVNPPPESGTTLTVSVAISDSGNFAAPGETGDRTITVDERGTADFSVATQDDDMDEPDGAITATVRAGTGYTVSDNTAEAEVTVRDDDAPVAAPPTEEKRAWHIRFGRSVSQQVVDALQQRFSTSSTTPSGLQLTLAGEAVTSDTPLEENHVLLSRLLGFERVSSQELAQGSSFSFSPDGAGARLSFWGKGAFSSFDGIEESITLIGEVTTALVGAEWSNERWRAGAALSHSWGSGSYQGDGDGADGRISSTLTGVFPYGRYALTPRLGLWATAGYGWGNITLNPDGDAPEYNPATTLALGAVGMDGLLLDGGSEGVTLTTTADALFLKTSSEAVAELESSEGNISRLRLGLEATRPFPLANGASLSPSLEVGLRQDNGDAETGFGMDLGAGLSWNDPERGITATVKGRTLLSHGAEHFQDQGLALSFSWQPSPSNRGPSFSLSHAVGLPAEGGLAALLNPTAIEVVDEPNSDGERFEARLAYGFPFYNNRLTLSPAVALALSTNSRTYGLLWSLTPHDENLVGEPWELSLEGERQENLSSSSTVDHSLKLRFALPL